MSSTKVLLSACSLGLLLFTQISHSQSQPVWEEPNTYQLNFETAEVATLNGAAYVVQTREYTLEATVIYKNGCLKPGYTQVLKQGQNLILTHVARVAGDLCTQALVEVPITVSLGQLEPGTYDIYDGHEGMNLIGRIEVGVGSIQLR